VTSSELKEKLEKLRLGIADMSSRIPAQIEQSDFVDELISAVGAGERDTIKSLVWQLYSENAEDLADEFEQVKNLAEEQALANVAAVK
jgi:hypothetical protein